MLPETTKQLIEQEATTHVRSYIITDEGFTRSNLKHSYIAAATIYAERAEELERENKELKERVEKMIEALDCISCISHENGRPGCNWGDTDYDSMSVAVGYNYAIDYVHEKAIKALQQWREEK